MSNLEAVLLGLVQGLTEFLPISSSGHLRIVPAFLGWDDPGAGFTAVIQLGTMAAVLIYFRAGPLADRARLAAGAARPLPAEQPGGEARLVHRPRHDPDLDLRLRLLRPDRVGRAQPLPDRLGADRLLLRDDPRRADRDPAARASRTSTAATALYIGFAQALALIPGVSRSGATISAGLLRGFDRVAAARYSFLLSVPAVVLSGLFELRHVGERTSASVEATVIATLVAFVSGYVAIAWLLRYLGTHSLGIFVAYRIPLGILVLSCATATERAAQMPTSRPEKANGPGQWAVRERERSLVRTRVLLAALVAGVKIRITEAEFPKRALFAGT